MSTTSRTSLPTPSSESASTSLRASTSSTPAEEELTPEAYFQWFQQRSSALRSSFCALLRKKNPNNPIIGLLTDALDVVDRTSDPATLSGSFIHSLKELYRGLRGLKASHDAKKEAKKVTTSSNEGSGGGGDSSSRINSSSGGGGDRSGTISSVNLGMQWVSSIYTKIHAILTKDGDKRSGDLEEILKIVDGTDFRKLFPDAPDKEAECQLRFVGDSSVTCRAWQGWAAVLRSCVDNEEKCRPVLWSVCIGKYVPPLAAQQSVLRRGQKRAWRGDDETLCHQRILYPGISTFIS